VCFEFEAPWDHHSTSFEFEASSLRAMPKTPPPTALDAEQLGAYFALIEVTSLLRHAIEQQLREAGDLSYVQFQLLARLGDAPTGSHRMTDLADGVVYSRSGLTYQAGLLEKAGLVTRAPSPDDERGITVTITDAGRARLAQVFPGHIEVVHNLLFEPLSRTDIRALAGLLEPVRDHMRATPPRSAAPRRRRGKD
jgi:DNA-binding MarR family transcriptional regulator